MATLTIFAGWELDTTTANEPRVRDVEIAKRAGLAQPRDVRRVIEKNLEELTAHGEIRVCALNAQNARGRPGTEYRLNQGQSVALMAMLRTPQARELRVALVKLFVAWRQSQLINDSAVRATVAQPSDASVQARIGDDPRASSYLRGLVKAASKVSGRSIPSIHGQLRKPWGVASVYRIPLIAIDATIATVQEVIDSAMNVRRLPVYQRQLPLFTGSSHGPN